MGALSTLTRASGISSSSAASIDSAVWMPCPISTRGMASTTSPCGVILIQPLSATSPACAGKSVASPRRLRGGSTPQPTTSAPPRPSAPSRNRRRPRRGTVALALMREAPAVPSRHA